MPEKSSRVVGKQGRLGQIEHREEVRVKKIRREVREPQA